MSKRKAPLRPGWPKSVVRSSPEQDAEGNRWAFLTKEGAPHFLAISKFFGLAPLLATLALLLLTSCASDPQTASSTAPTTSTISPEQTAVNSLAGTRVTFNFADSYTSEFPNPNTGCAGDLRNFYDPFLTVNGAPSPLPTNPANFTATLVPSFLNNVSVDLTDTGLNLASLEAGSSSPSSSQAVCTFSEVSTNTANVSSCASFDFVSAGGFTSSLGGSILLFGGLNSSTYTPNSAQCGPIQTGGLVVGSTTNSATTSFDSCTGSFYALAGNSTSPQGGTGSAWLNLTPTFKSAGPIGLAGASGGYNANYHHFISFGGGSHLSGFNSVSSSLQPPGSPTRDTWIFDLDSMQWTHFNTDGNTNSTLLGTLDCGSSYVGGPCSVPVLQVPKATSGRALFGYQAVPGMAVSELGVTNSGGAIILTNANIDTTDRLITVGGMGSCTTSSSSSGVTITTGPSPTSTTTTAGITTTTYVTIVTTSPLPASDTASASATNGICNDTHKFNPTYAPEYFDEYAVLNTSSVPTTLHPTQWIDSYPAQILSNITDQTSIYSPTNFPYSPNNVTNNNPIFISPAVAINFGLTTLFKLSNSTSSSIHAGTFGGDTTGVVTGYLLGAGGFYGDNSSAASINTLPSAMTPAVSFTGNSNSGSNACTSQYMCGGMKVQLRHSEPIQSVADYIEATNFADSSGYSATPGRWVDITTGEVTPAQGDDKTPWLGGVSLVKGLVPSTNDVVMFGGLACKNYLSDSSGCVAGSSTTGWNTGTSPGYPLYFRFGADPIGNSSGAGFKLTSSTTSGTPATFSTIYSSGTGTISMGNTAGAPFAAGMAAAHGTDPCGNPVVVAWGGMTNGATVDGSGKIYYLFNNSGTPTWGSTSAGSVAAGTAPTGYANATLTFSHVTNKFYLFGGYSPVNNTGLSPASANTWELSFNSTGSSGSLNCSTSSPSVVNCGATGNCSFSWRLLNASAGQTCYPNCPQARRSHGMIEANYNNWNVINNPTHATDDPICTAADKPCSFGLFMSGGTPDGVSTLAETWMFDPTANNGAGHWQLMGELPPRTLAAAATLTYTLPKSGTQVDRLVVFGGETGMQNPSIPTQAATAGYFVAPTLGDTWIFDVDQNTWNRAQLYGLHYPSSAIGNSTMTTTQDRQSSLEASSPSLYAPPPLSGAMMIVRTLSKGYSGANHLSTDAAESLTIPQIFLFGGRKKDGTYLTFDHVYKFCIGSTGEKPPSATPFLNIAASAPNDASCDTYDPTLNPNSPNPTSSYSGRWIPKSPVGGSVGTNPQATPSTTAAFMGAVAYDSLHDLIVTYGGLSPGSSPSGCTTSTCAVTDSSNRSTPNNQIWEYIPPSAISGTGVISPGTAQNDGYWQTLPNCSGSATPTARFGHNMIYDPSHQALVIIGGYDSSGNLLSQTQTATDGSTTATPEIWFATRDDVNLCYTWTQQTTLQSYTNSGGGVVDTSSDAPNSGLAQIAAGYIPPSGYGTGYYTMLNQSCVGAGPVASSDSTINSTQVGGVYFDLNRSNLGTNENLLLHIKFISLGNGMQGPNDQSLTTTDTPVFKIHLDQTGQSTTVLQQTFQPRDLAYTSTNQYPILANDIAVYAPAPGQVQEEQILIPIAINPLIDRIRVERYSGSAILINAGLFRLGPQEQ